MQKYLAALALSLAVISTQTPAQAAGKSRNVAASVAIGIGLVAAAVIASSRGSHASSFRSTSYERGYGDRCMALRHACLDGSERACWKHENRC